ncbi:hypothetical protein CH256_20720 [Rhodococcus sp. 05-2254-6]|nr:hypothetical protein CH256_20720 [Rhodococcus sp. 05-2254-6]OZE33048.1 hypothetical protein CH259_21775 [Rhodococcus sp. 05-2254-4]OZE44056.1 hypothetical protein CH261_16880 [Rhodococcus sp. 05-2254-3]OZE56261.1 hypothetical protein CH283_02040 [Rhodococcus sp. 05-2254-2]OZF46832.1 hypothetical protein CH291_14970 [Rhodococcus sp. 14-1411-2a]
MQRTTAAHDLLSQTTTVDPVPWACANRGARRRYGRGSRRLVAFVTRIVVADRAELEGVSADRSPPLVAGALVAEASMRASTTKSPEICPWALKEGLMLRKLDPETDGDPVVSSR